MGEFIIGVRGFGACSSANYAAGCWGQSKKEESFHSKGKVCTVMLWPEGRAP